MATFDAVRRLAACAAVTSTLTSCVTTLDNLHGYADAGATSTAEVLATTTEELHTTGAVSVSTHTESLGDAGEDESSEANPSPTTPECIDGTLNSDGFCVPQVRCAPGTFVAEADGERVCSPCASGHFSSEYDAEECETWRDCEVGDYVKEPGTSTADRECEACPDGVTTTTENSGTCTGASDCLAGNYKSDDTCEPCSAGNYCPGTTDAEIPCESDTWDDDTDPGTPCVVKTSCAAGQFVTDEGNAIADRGCDFCGEETFSTENNAASCDAWMECAAGSYVSLQGTPTTNRECAACSSGTFSLEPNVATCDTWKTCAAPSEYVVTEPSAEQDRTCGDCESGYQASEDNAAACDEPIPPNLVTNYDFESDTNGWTSWVGSVSTSTAQALTGTRSLLVAGSGTGPAATTLDSVVQAGASYDVSFWVTVGKVATAQVNITRSLTCNGTTTYLWLDEDTAVVSGTWTQLSGTFSIPSSCGSPKAQVYAEGSGANVDLYVDDVSVRQAP